MITIKINGKKYSFYESGNVSLKLDTVASSFSVSGFIDENDKEKRAFLKPLTYPSCEVWLNYPEFNVNEKLITGTIINPGISSVKVKSLSSLSGYSKTGILEDCNTPLELYPLQNDNITLSQIAKRYADYFGLRLKIFDNALQNASIEFEKTTAEPEQSCKDYLSKLCNQRNLTLSHDNRGWLLIYKIEANIQPKVSISDKDANVISMTLNPNGQGVHSECTAFRQALKTTDNAAQSTVKSPFTTINRPISRILKQGDVNNTEEYAKRILSTEAKNFPVTIKLRDWLVKGEVLRAGFYITLESNKLFIQKTKFIIESIEFKISARERTTTIKAVLPCVYTGELPAKSPFK